MPELEDHFAELGITQYLDVFLEQGFDTWETILDITESDFDALGVKLGHRRKLQRRIADCRGVSADRALGSPARGTPTDERSQDEARKGSVRGDGRLGSAARTAGKRKYRRHPKPDDNAPERPPSAYVIFSNKMRDDLKGRTLSFTEIAKLVGENWQSLSPEEKEIYEREAFGLREKYNGEMAEYKKTENYKVYSAYLAEFKAKQAHQQQNADADITKRPKLEDLPGTGSGTTGSNLSQVSQLGDNVSTNRMRVDSSASGTCPWPEPPGQLSPAVSTNQPSSNLGNESGISTQSSPSGMSLNSFPPYREPAYVGPQGLPWREASRDDKGSGMQRHVSASSVQATRSTDIGTPLDAPPLSNSDRQLYSNDLQRPPLLSHESSTASASSYFTPRTPMEPQLDRAFPMPTLYSHSSSGSFDSTLPPIRPPSLSPQTSVFTKHPSPSGTAALPHQASNASAQTLSYKGVQAVDFQQPVPSMRDYPPSSGPGSTTSIVPLRYERQQRTTPPAPPSSSQQAEVDPRDTRMREYISATAPEDAQLDPVSALLKAGEIVNSSSSRRSHGRHRPHDASP